MKAKIDITQSEVALLLLIFLFGLVFSTRQFILFLDTLNPLQGIILFYIVYYLFLALISYFGFSIIGYKIKNPIQIIGSLLIWFSFFAVTNWENPYIQIVTGRDPNAISIIFYHTEDGLLWYLTTEYLNIRDVETAKYFVYVIFPTILTFIGILMIREGRLIQIG